MLVHDQFLAGDDEGPSQQLHQAIDEAHDRAKIGDVDERNGELVAARSRHEIALAERRLDTRTDVAQYLVAAAMVDGVIDVLELVEVEAEDGDAGAVPMNARHGLGKFVGGLVALIEIDDEGALRLAFERQRKGDSGEIRGRRVGRTLIQRDLGLLLRGAGQERGKVLFEREAGRLFWPDQPPVTDIGRARCGRSFRPITKSWPFGLRAMAASIAA